MPMSPSSSLLQKAVEDLLKREPDWKRATQPPAKGGRTGATSIGKPSSGAGAQAGLAESDYTLREYWPVQVMRTSDGVLTFEVEPIKAVMLDSGYPFTFKEPPTP